MTLDLSGLVAAQEALFSDECTITRNPGGAADDTIDPVTLQLVSAAPTIVFAGPCIIARPPRLASGQETPTQDAGVPAIYRLKLPLTLLTAEPQVGDKVTCTASANDPALTLPGRTFLITRPIVDGFATSRICEMETAWVSA